MICKSKLRFKSSISREPATYLKLNSGSMNITHLLLKTGFSKKVTLYWFSTTYCLRCIIYAVIVSLWNKMNIFILFDFTTGWHTTNFVALSANRQHLADAFASMNFASVLSRNKKNLHICTKNHIYLIENKYDLINVNN